MAAKTESVTRTVTVAFLVCLVCAIVVATAAVSLRPVQEKNKTLDRQVNILQSAGLYQPGMDVKAAFETIDRRFVSIATGEFVEKPDSYDQRKAAKNPAENITLDVDKDVASIKRQAKVAEVYLARNEDGSLSRIILPVHGYGLWSTLYGFIALQPDANTVAGLGFYEHAETPGLGGEVDNPKWKAIWPGKKLYDDDGDVAITVIKGTVDKSTPNAEHKVDGLAGATLTTKGVDNLVRFWVGENGFEPFLERVRQGELAANTSSTDSAVTLAAHAAQ